MSVQPKTEAQIAASEQFQAYMKGWRDGIGRIPHRAGWVCHENKLLGAAYSAGHEDGWATRTQAQNDAALRYGFEPEILR